MANQRLDIIIRKFQEEIYFRLFFKDHYWFNQIGFSLSYEISLLLKGSIFRFMQFRGFKTNFYAKIANLTLFFLFIMITFFNLNPVMHGNPQKVLEGQDFSCIGSLKIFLV